MACVPALSSMMLASMCLFATVLFLPESRARLLSLGGASSTCCMICPEQFYAEASSLVELGVITDAHRRSLNRRFDLYHQYHGGPQRGGPVSPFPTRSSSSSSSSSLLVELGSAAATAAVAARRRTSGQLRTRVRVPGKQEYSAATEEPGNPYLDGNPPCCKVCPDLFTQPGGFDSLLELHEQGRLTASAEVSHGGEVQLTERVSAVTGEPCPKQDRCCAVCPRQLYPPRDIIDTQNFVELGAKENSPLPLASDEASFFAARFAEKGKQTAAGSAAPAVARPPPVTRSEQGAGFEQGVSHADGVRRRIHSASSGDGEVRAGGGELPRFMRRADAARTGTQAGIGSGECCVACLFKLTGQYEKGGALKDVKVRELETKHSLLMENKANPANTRSDYT